MSEELKPCPFCGGEARIIVEPYESGYLVGCGDDGCHGFVGVNIRYESYDEAAAAWNRRAERTCRIEVDVEKVETDLGMMEVREYWCSECYGRMAADDDYCPNCGAKVVDDDD